VATRYIDTSGLPEKFDVADLIARGVTGKELAKWCKARLKPGPPPMPAPAQKKPAKAETSGGQSSEATATPASSGEPAAVAPKGNAARGGGSNVVALRKPEPDPEGEADPGIPPEYSHDALADQFASKYSKLFAYVPVWGRWMTWDGSRWQPDDTLRAQDTARRVCREAGNEALMRPELIKKSANIATSLTSANCIRSVESLAKSDTRIVTSSSTWDKDEWALNTPGGIVDLRDGSIRPTRRDDYCTKVTRATPGGDCPAWKSFLHTATAGDRDLQAFLARVVGYCLTGSTREERFFFVYGEGGNGKGTFLGTIDWLLNDYARTASMEMFVEQKFQSHPTDLAALQGARLVTAQETEEGKRWADARIKAMTGGDVITARFMRQDEFSYKPQFKLLFAGNHKPSLRNVDEAIRRRLYLIPFTVTPIHKDTTLKKKLQGEAAGILQWAIDGCLDWLDKGSLMPPDRVLATTDEYFEDQDTFGQYLAECCEFHEAFYAPSADLYRQYQQWSESVGEFPLQRRRWLDQLVKRNLRAEKRGGSMIIKGMRARVFNA
jgi:putative DNA primase/helicase